jgi:hypothetical protein
MVQLAQALLLHGAMPKIVLRTFVSGSDIKTRRGSGAGSTSQHSFGWCEADLFDTHVRDYALPQSTHYRPQYEIPPSFFAVLRKPRREGANLIFYFLLLFTTFLSFPYISLHFITFHYISLHFLTFPYISLHFITFHYNATAPFTRQSLLVRHCNNKKAFLFFINAFPCFSFFIRFQYLSLVMFPSFFLFLLEILMH